MVLRKVLKAGGSYYVTIPKKYISALGILQGGYVEVKVEKKRRVVITPLKLTTHKKGGIF